MHAELMKRSFQAADLGSPSGDGTKAIGDTPIKSKSRACSECKKHKIKCQIDSGQQKCRRCLRQDLNCMTNNTLQKFVDDDTKWKESAMLQTLRLEAAVSDVLQNLHLPNLHSYGMDLNSGSDVALPYAVAPTEETLHVMSSRHGTLDVSSIDITREPSQEPNIEEGRVVSAPTEALYEVTKMRNLMSNRIGNQHLTSNPIESDLISRGILPLNEATSLFESFNHTMSQLLWGGIIIKHSTLESVRRSSSLLLAAILTVASIHIRDKDEALKNCFDEFISLASRSMFRRSYKLDDIRALCIGAFWLPDLSWRLSGHAVRLATEMGLHQSFQKIENGDRSYYEHAQLWFLLYVCDHQFATTYGRPPTIHEDAAITNYEAFLQLPTTTLGDVRLMAQVALFIIHTHLYHHFGIDNDQPIIEEDFQQIRHYNLELEKWRTIWQPRLADNQYVNTYPSKGVVLHYYFAKFQLNSLSLRAISPNTSNPLSTARRESANIAISSAMSTLAFIVDEPDVRDNIIGIPLFTLTMLAFSAVFLLKVTLKWNSCGTSNQRFTFSTPLPAARTSGIYTSAEAVEELVHRVILLLRNAVASEKHLARHIASGLSKLLASFKISIRGELNDVIQGAHQQTMAQPPSQQGYQNTINDVFEVPGVPGNSGAGPWVDDVGFSFDEIWQNYPATTLDFLISQWQETELC